MNDAATSPDLLAGTSRWEILGVLGLWAAVIVAAVVAYRFGRVLRNLTALRADLEDYRDAVETRLGLDVDRYWDDEVTR